MPSYDGTMEIQNRTTVTCSDVSFHTIQLAKTIVC